LEAKGKQRDVLFASGIRTISELQRLERQQRNNVIRAIKRKEGVTIRQLARIAKDIQKCNPSK
jgi:predicted RecB family nuclease